MPHLCAVYWTVLGVMFRSMNDGRIPIRRHGIGHVEAYDVTVEELERLEKEGSDVGFDFQISLFCITMATSFLIALILSPPTGKTFDVFVLLVIVGLLVGLIFGIKWFRGRGARSLTIKKIKERQIIPFGEEGEELKPSQLEDLPSEEAGPAEGKQ